MKYTQKLIFTYVNSLSVCLSVCLTHAHTHTYIYIYIYMQTNNKHIHTYIHTHTHIYIYANKQTNKQTNNKHTYIPSLYQSISKLISNYFPISFYAFVHSMILWHLLTFWGIFFWVSSCISSLSHALIKFYHYFVPYDRKHYLTNAFRLHLPAQAKVNPRHPPKGLLSWAKSSISRSSSSFSFHDQLLSLSLSLSHPTALGVFAVSLAGGSYHHWIGACKVIHPSCLRLVPEQC